MISTKNPLPGNLYLVKHSSGIRNVLLYIHEDGNASSAWANSEGERIYRFQAFAEPTENGCDHWINDVRNEATWCGVFVGRPSKPPHLITDVEIFDLYNEFNVTHG